MAENKTNGKAPAKAPIAADPKDYVVLTPEAPHEVVHKGKYLSPADAFAAAIARTDLGDGDTASYIVVAGKFFQPRTVKVAVERKLVFS